jgi:hypothetical protein
VNTAWIVIAGRQQECVQYSEGERSSSNSIIRSSTCRPCCSMYTHHIHVDLQGQYILHGLPDSWMQQRAPALPMPCDMDMNTSMRRHMNMHMNATITTAGGLT